MELWRGTGTTEDDAASLGQEAAGWPFFGQFVAHDITADRSLLQAHADPSRLRNARSPQLKEFWPDICHKILKK
jgi:hypothetical protein